MTDRERAEKWANTYPDSEFDPQVVEDDLVADFAAVRADEREGCAKIAETQAPFYVGIDTRIIHGNAKATAIAAAIRARGDSE